MGERDGSGEDEAEPSAAIDASADDHGSDGAGDDHDDPSSDESRDDHDDPSSDESRDEAGGTSGETAGDRTGGDDADRDGELASDESSVVVSEAGAVDPAAPRWEKPDVEDIPSVDGPKTRPGKTGAVDDDSKQGMTDESTAGMPNTARAPGETRLKRRGTEGYIVALELCARLPDDVRLPEEAADLVPVALEAELEQDVQAFAAAEFDDASPHVETLDFVEADGDVWLRIRLGVTPGAFTDLDPAEIRAHALQELDTLL